MSSHNAELFGCMPVIVTLSSTQEWESGHYEWEVDTIHWRKRDGSPGKAISQATWDRAEADDCYFANLMEGIFEQMAYEQSLAEDGGVEPPMFEFE